QVNMTINKSTDQPSAISVNNQIVVRDNKDANETTLVNYYNTIIAPVANAPVGNITADITNTNNTVGESALGDVIGDAQLAYTAGAGSQLAFMNPGGIRASLTYASSTAGEGDGVVTYGEAFTVQPFNNLVVTQDMTGQQIMDALEQSWQGCFGRTQSTVILQTLATF